MKIYKIYKARYLSQYLLSRIDLCLDVTLLVVFVKI